MNVKNTPFDIPLLDYLEFQEANNYRDLDEKLKRNITGGVLEKLRHTIDQQMSLDLQFYARKGKGKSTLALKIIEEHFKMKYANEGYSPEDHFDLSIIHFTTESLERWFRENPDLYPYGIYMAELVDRLVSGEESCAEICNLLLDGWKLLGQDENIDRALLCRAFELKLAAAAGYKPHLHSCTSCGSEASQVFSPRQGGLLCSRCKGAEAMNIEPGTVAIASRLIEMPLNNAGMIRLTARQREELTLATTAFLAYHLDLGEIKSRRLLPE